MKAMNSVAQFCCVVLRILQNHMPHVAMSFLNDVGVKESKTRYSNTKILELSEVQKFILKYIQNLNMTLTDLKRAEAMMSAEKLMFCMTEFKIMSFVCNTEERHLNAIKILKVLE